MRPLAILLFLLASTCVRAQVTLQSPDGTLRAEVSAASPPTLSLFAGDEQLLEVNGISLEYERQNYPTGSYTASDVETVDDTVEPIVATKTTTIRDNYRAVTLGFDEVAVEVRLYNEGLAYRITNLPTGNVTAENFDLRLDPATELFYPKEESYYSHNERVYLRGTPADFADSLASLPVLGVLPGGYHVWVSESNLYNFPGLWVMANAEGLRGTHPALPRTVTDVNDRTETIERHDYIAKVEGGQATPWRILAVSENAAGLLSNQLTYLLAAPHEGDYSWVRPGQVAWDWYNANNVYGVDFEAGVNTNTYKYYIDFAAAYGIPYVILDEGWSPTEDVLTTVPDIDMEELTAYGREKNVGLILWGLWKPFHENLQAACRQYRDWGIAGVKIDFMQRDDQAMVRMYEEMAEATADHQLLIDFHGAYKPAGLHRTYPNVITREGIKGLEWYKFGNPRSGVGPDHDVTLPFTRMVAGPIDFTPGAMRNEHAEGHQFNFDRPVSLGTRAHQLAMYVVYESPLQMLADSPSAYLREPEVTEWITSIPTTWQQTVPLDGVVGDYVVVAREAQNGDWYLGALNDTTARELTVPLDFLPEGTYELEVFRDGINHRRFAEDYKHETVVVEAGQDLLLPLGMGGGYVGRFRRR